jgi:hypothetical protein
VCPSAALATAPADGYAEDAEAGDH